MLLKDQVLEIVQGAIGVETKKEAEGFLKEIDAVMETLANTLVDKDKVALGKFLTIEKRHKEATSGKTRGVDWTSPAKDVLKAKVSKKLERQ